MTNSIPEFEETDCFLIIGSNTTEAHPLIATWVMRAQKRGAKVIVVDPRKTQIARLADLYLCQRPGTDVAWLNGMMHVIIQEDLYDKDFVNSRTEGFEELRAAVADYTPERVEALTGIPVSDLVTASLLYAQAERAAILYTMGITQHTTGVDNVLSVANLAMLTGNVGRPGTGVNPLRGQNNVQGACDLGGLPNVYSGYQPVTNEAVQTKFREAWGAAPPLRVGLTVTEMLNAAHHGTVKALYVMGENPMVSDPDLNHVRAALEQCEFLVVQDIFPTETVEFADVVLPGVSFAEKDGTFTGTDRRIQLVRQAIAPLGDARQDWEIVANLAKRLNAIRNMSSRASRETPCTASHASWDYASPAAIMAEIAALTPSYGGVSYERLEREGFLQWPVPTADHPGTPYLHKGKFSRGVGHFTAVAFKEPAEAPDEEYPFLLTTGRMMFHYHTGSMTRRSEKLDREVPEGYVELSPEDAVQLGLGKSARVRVISRRGQIETKAWITRRVPPGIVFIPFHFAEEAANVLTNPAMDPVAKIPEYKVAAVRIERVA
jgi:formate dehydrogenase alpha subunit